MLQQRDELEREIALVRVPALTRANAASSLAEAEAGSRSLDEAERAAWISWAGDPNGTQPAPRVDERRDLERRRALAAADLRGASAACEAVEPRLNAINAALKRIQREMLRLKVDDLLAEAKAKAMHAMT